MAEWLELENPPITYQPDQMEFLKARRRRRCPSCLKEFSIDPVAPNPNCLECNIKGVRLFDRLAVIAGRRFGKTRFGSIAAVEEALIPGTVGWACAPTIPKLHRYIIPAFQMLIPRDWVADWNSEFKDLRLKNGSLIHFQTLESPDQGRGQGLDWLWIDEVAELTDKHWEVISPSLGDRHGMAFFTTSPRSYDWVYEKLYRPAEEGLPGYWALLAKTADNPRFQDAEGRAFLERAKAEMSPEMYAQEYEGSFVTFTGAIYPHFDNLITRTDVEVKKLIPEWPDIDSWRQTLIGLDTGADHPFGGIKLVSTEFGLVAIGEYLERHRSFQEHAFELKTLAGGSSAKWACNKNERQGMIELAQHGIYCKAAENDVVAGIERVKTWINNKQIWFVESRVPKLIKQMKAYRWDENKSPDGQAKKERVYKVNDELPDCLRYALMTWPRPSQLKPPEGEKRRDLSHLDPEIRSTIEWVRRVEGREASPKKLDVTGDFWN
jgi:hypothetical protein